MGIGEIFAFIRALPEMIKAIDRMTSAILQLKQDQVDKELEKIKSEVATTLKQIEGAQTNEDRRRLALELATRMSR